MKWAKSISLLGWNARSLRTWERKIHFEYLLWKQNPDVALVLETWLTKDYNIKGYQSI